MTGCTLYQIEDHLDALVNTMALAEEAEVREAILDEIGQVVRGGEEKSGCCGRILTTLRGPGRVCRR